MNHLGPPGGDFDRVVTGRSATMGEWQAVVKLNFVENFW
jgi:hypothetical protein